VDIQCKLLGEVEAEDAHDGLCVDGISAGDDVYVVVALSYDVNEILYVVDCVDADLCGCHNTFSFLFCFGACTFMLSHHNFFVNGNFVVCCVTLQ